MIMPTPEQCNENAKVGENDDGRGLYACWYPQMGGYGSRCVVVAPYAPTRPDDGPGCFEAYVWHDGEFPFSDREPARLHHCRAAQFVRFGTLVEGLK
jgi:hypothetical protein